MGLQENIAQNGLSIEELRDIASKSRFLSAVEDDLEATGEMPAITDELITSIEASAVTPETSGLTARMKKIARGVGTGFLLLFNTNEADF